MKRLFLFMVTILCVVNLSAQKVSLNRAYNFFYEKDYLNAKEAIDLCSQDEKLKGKAQTWLYKGNICFYLANEEYAAKQADDTYVIKNPDAPVEAFDAFVKANELNKNIEAFDMMNADDGISKLYTLLLIRGVDLLINNDFAKAKSILEKAITSYESKTPEYPLKGELYYYFAYSLEALKAPFEQVTLNYEKAIKDGSVDPNVFLRLIDVYHDKNPEKVKSLIDEAKQKAPNNPNILVAEVDYYFSINETAQAKQLLANLPASVYSNADALINVSNFYIKDKNYAEAKKLLLKANQLNPNHYLVVYNLGVCSYYLAEESFAKVNQLQIDGKNEDAQRERINADNLLIDAENYFLRYLNTNPDDIDVLNSLKSIYARMNSPKYDDIVKKIDDLKK